MFKKKAFLILLLILVFPATLALFRPGFFVSDDGDWMVIRLSDFHRSFVAGQIPVRWAARLNYGYGYPVFNFSYPLSLYWGEGFHLLGFSFVDSVKLVFIFSFFIAAVLMYFFGRELWGEWGGVLAAIFYTYAPYRLLDTYIRGSLGEAMSFIFVPLIFWMIAKLGKRQCWRDVAIGALAYAGLLVSHNIMALLFTPLIFGYMGYLVITRGRSQRRPYIGFLLMIILGLGLACFFWLPALYDKQFTVLSQFSVANFQDHFFNLQQLLAHLGLVQLLTVIFSAIFLTKLRRQTSFFLFVLAATLFLVLPLSLPVWQAIPLLWWVQFPWRLLAVATFCSAVLAGSVSHQWLAMLLLALVILLNVNHAKPQVFVNQPESFYATNEATTTIQDEYMPIWVKEKPVSHASQKVALVAGEGLIEKLVFNSKKVNFDLQTKTDSVVQINTLFFPGWQVKIDGQPVSLDYDNPQGLITFAVPAGSYRVLAEFGETKIRLTADAISLVSLLVVAGLLIKDRKK